MSAETKSCGSAAQEPMRIRRPGLMLLIASSGVRNLFAKRLVHSSMVASFGVLASKHPLSRGHNQM